MIGDEPGTPAMFPLSDFEILDRSIPDSWVIISLRNDGFELTPLPWAKDNFWEHFFSQEPGALAAFESEYEKILAFGKPLEPKERF
jgi:hypothetical protein